MSSAKANSSKVDEEQKKPGFFSKLIFLGVLPILYAIVLAMIILHFAGVKVDTQVKWVADHTKIFSPKNEAQAKQAAAKTAVSTSAKTTRDTKTSPKKTQAQSQSTKTSETVTSSQSNPNSAQESVTIIANPTADSLENMDPTSAAKLLANMSDTDALRNLRQLSPDAQSAIIAEMPADVGARLTVELSNGEEPASSTSSSSQLYHYMKPDQIASILNGIKNNEEVLKQIKQLDPSTASQVISQLNPQVAGWIVTHMN